MITFLTLFLGLTFGVQTVELAVESPVAAVELRLDGAVRRRLEGPPWNAGIDFGPGLGPWRLEAVAFGTDGVELGRAARWVNLGGDERAARLWVEHEARGERRRATRARLVWRSVEHDSYRALRVTFDGTPLAVDDPDAIPLPPHDPDVLHVLSAELTFADGSTTRADVAFGGVYGEETIAALTGVPVLVEGRRRLRDAAGAGRWRAGDGSDDDARALPVLAVDHGAATLLAVLDRGADPHLRHLGVAMARRAAGGSAKPARAAGVGGDPGTGDRLVLPHARNGPLLQVGLRPGDRLHLVRPTAERSPSGYRLFGISEALTLERGGGSAWLLSHLRLGEHSGPQRLADAVASAGLRAARSGRPRAVLLVLGPDAGDESRFPPAEVRRYLGRLGVPLVVAYVEQPGVAPDEAQRRSRAEAETARGERAARLASARAAWGRVVDVADVRDWVALHRDLRDDLAAQRILWVGGVHDPSAVRPEDARGWLQPLARGEVP